MLIWRWAPLMMDMWYDVHIYLMDIFLKKEMTMLSIHDCSDHELMTRWAPLMDGVGSAAYEMRQYPPLVQQQTQWTFELSEHCTGSMGYTYVICRSCYCVQFCFSFVSVLCAELYHPQCACQSMTEWRSAKLCKDMQTCTTNLYKSEPSIAPQTITNMYKSVPSTACSVYTTGGVVVQKLHLWTAAVKVLSLAKVFNFLFKQIGYKMFCLRPA